MMYNYINLTPLLHRVAGEESRACGSEGVRAVLRAKKKPFSPLAGGSSRSIAKVDGRVFSACSSVSFFTESFPPSPFAALRVLPPAGGEKRRPHKGRSS